MLDRACRRRLNFKVEFGRQTDRSNHPNRIFSHPQLGPANRADQPFTEVANSADIIEHTETTRVIEERINGEVPPERIFLRRTKSVVVPNQQVVVIYRVGPPPKSGDLDIIRAEEHMNEPKAPPDQPRIPEKRADLVGMS